MSTQREPDQIYARARDEGRRRPARPVRNLGLAIGGNLVGGLLLVTFARSAQALGATSS